MTADTLVAGWWGVLSFFVTPVILISNALRRGSVAALAAPRPVAGHAPLPVGRPLLARWQAIGLVVPCAPCSRS